MINKEPININKILENLANDPNLMNQYKLYLIQKDWNNILGNTISKNCLPINYKSSILTIKVNSSVWRNELKLRNEQIIEIINNYFAYEIVKEIKIR